MLLEGKSSSPVSGSAPGFSGSPFNVLTASEVGHHFKEVFTFLGTSDTLGEFFTSSRV